MPGSTTSRSSRHTDTPGRGCGPARPRPAQRCGPRGGRVASPQRRHQHVRRGLVTGQGASDRGQPARVEAARAVALVVGVDHLDQRPGGRPTARSRATRRHCRQHGRQRLRPTARSQSSTQCLAVAARRSATCAGVEAGARCCPVGEVRLVVDNHTPERQAAAPAHWTPPPHPPPPLPQLGPGPVTAAGPTDHWPGHASRERLRTARPPPTQPPPRRHRRSPPPPVPGSPRSAQSPLAPRSSPGNAPPVTPPPPAPPRSTILRGQRVGRPSGGCGGNQWGRGGARGVWGWLRWTLSTAARPLGMADGGGCR